MPLRSNLHTLMPDAPAQLPYKIAVLCYLYDDDGHVLLLHRRKNPNAGMYSPIGGKLDITAGESPHQCARREINEETGLTLPDDQVRLVGIVSERGYEGETHWLMFLFVVTRSIGRDELHWSEFDEGVLEWIPIDRVADMAIPLTDREVMWPLVQQHRGGGAGTGGGFFMAHIDCTSEPMQWRLDESRLPGSP